MGTPVSIIIIDSMIWVPCSSTHCRDRVAEPALLPLFQRPPARQLQRALRQALRAHADTRAPAGRGRVAAVAPAGMSPHWPIVSALARDPEFHSSDT